MSKLLNPRITPDYMQYAHGGVAKAIKLQCNIDETMKTGTRFQPRMVDTRDKIYFSDKKSCL